MSRYSCKSFLWGLYNDLDVLKASSCAKCSPTCSEREFEDIIDSGKFLKCLRIENVPILVQVVRFEHYNAVYDLKAFSYAKCPHTCSEREFGDIIESGKFSQCLRIENVPIVVQVVSLGTIQCTLRFERGYLIQMSPYSFKE